MEAASTLWKCPIGLSCRVVHEGQLTNKFEGRTGVTEQECLLSPFLFILAIDWIITSATNQKRNGIQWTWWSQLDNLDFADDLALVSHNHQQMQERNICPASCLSVSRTETQ